MPTKAQIIAAIQAHANASGDLNLRASLGSPIGEFVEIDNVATPLGQAYRIPGFTDSLLYGISIVSGVYGEDRQEVVFTGRVTNSSSDFESRLTLVVPARTGLYEIRWRAVVDSDTAQTIGEVRLYNNTAYTQIGSHLAYTVPVGELWPVQGEVDVTFTGTAKTFTLQHRDQSGFGTQGIQDMCMVIKRVG